MACFQKKQVGNGREKEKIKFDIPFRSFLTRNRKFQKRMSRKLKNLKKKTIMASFQAKTGWKRLKKRENKNYRFVSFLPDA